MDLRDDVIGCHALRIRIDVERCFNIYVKAGLSDQRRENVHALLRFVAFPATPHHQRSLRHQNLTPCC